MSQTVAAQRDDGDIQLGDRVQIVQAATVSLSGPRQQPQQDYQTYVPAPQDYRATTEFHNPPPQDYRQSGGPALNGGYPPVAMASRRITGHRAIIRRWFGRRITVRRRRISSGALRAPLVAPHLLPDSGSGYQGNSSQLHSQGNPSHRTIRYGNIE